MWKVSKYGVFSGPYFTVLGMNAEIYSVFKGSLNYWLIFKLIQSRKLILVTFMSSSTTLVTDVTSLQYNTLLKSWSALVHALHKKWNFPLRISSVNVTESAANWVFGHIYWRNPLLKTSFSVKWCFLGSFSEIAESFISEKKLLLNRKDGIPRNITQHVFFTISCN